MKIFILLLFIILAAGCAATQPQEDAPPAAADENGAEPGIGGANQEADAEPGTGVESGIMEVSVFGIGRADAILIRTESYAVMIDTGERQHGRPIVGYLRSQGISAIDYLIITHFDSDHVGGAYIILRDMQVAQVIVPNYSRDTNHVMRFESALRYAGLEPLVLTEPLELTLDGARFIIDPTGLEYMHFPRADEPGFGEYSEDYETDNAADYAYERWGFAPTSDDFSIIVRITHGANNFLFTGDAWNIRLQELLENDELMGVAYDFLKVPRHGRHSRSSVPFIHATSPRYAVITGFHPEYAERYYSERPADARVIAALEYVGAQIFFTMSVGVRAESDGSRLVVEYRHFFGSD